MTPSHGFRAFGYNLATLFTGVQHGSPNFAVIKNSKHGSPNITQS